MKISFCYILLLQHGNDKCLIVLDQGERRTKSIKAFDALAMSGHVISLMISRKSKSDACITTCLTFVLLMAGQR